MIGGQRYKCRVEGPHVRNGRGPFVDGDTFLIKRLLTKDGKRDWEIVENGIWVRLLEVDTPERGQPGYQEAGEFTSRWLTGRMDPDNPWPLDMVAVYKDVFGRWLCYIGHRESGGYIHDALYEAGHTDRISPYDQIEYLQKQEENGE